MDRVYTDSFQSLTTIIRWHVSALLTVIAASIVLFARRSDRTALSS
jgi:hypothetical protein